MFVVGDRVEDDFASKTVERRRGEEIAGTQQARGCAFGVATEEEIFVAGGRENWELHLKTCEMFNISTNDWQLIGSY